jgi:hypothetical protein
VNGLTITNLYLRSQRSFGGLAVSSTCLLREISPTRHFVAALTHVTQQTCVLTRDRSGDAKIAISDRNDELSGKNTIFAPSHSRKMFDGENVIIAANESTVLRIEHMHRTGHAHFKLFLHDIHHATLKHAGHFLSYDLHFEGHHQLDGTDLHIDGDATTLEFFFSKKPLGGTTKQVRRGNGMLVAKMAELPQSVELKIMRGAEPLTVRLRIDCSLIFSFSRVQRSSTRSTLAQQASCM